MDVSPVRNRDATLNSNPDAAGRSIALGRDGQATHG
jgi:hypothetical protein